MKATRRPSLGTQVLFFDLDVCLAYAAVVTAVQGDELADVYVFPCADWPAGHLERFAVLHPGTLSPAASARGVWMWPRG